MSRSELRLALTDARYGPPCDRDLGDHVLDPACHIPHSLNLAGESVRAELDLSDDAGRLLVFGQLDLESIFRVASWAADVVEHVKRRSR